MAFESAPPLPPVSSDLTLAAGCVLVEPLVSLAPLPAFDTAAMDGWAVRGSGPWQVVGQGHAGATVPKPLASGTAFGVATGSAVPPGTDAVLPMELGIVDGTTVSCSSIPDRHVRRTGEEAATGTILLQPGVMLSPAAVGLAAAAGYDNLRVHPQPRVHGLITGDELLRQGRPGAGRIRDAIGPGLPFAITSLGGVPTGIAYLNDDRAAMADAVRSADADVVVVTGATSVGAADHLSAVLSALGAELVIDGVRVRPGHPQLLARLPDGRLVIGLPGNPLAALVGMVTLLAPALAGLASRRQPGLERLQSGSDLASANGMHRLVPVRVRAGVANQTGHDGSAMLRGAAAADAFAIVEPDRPVTFGDDVDAVRLPG